MRRGTKAILRGARAFVCWWCAPRPSLPLPPPVLLSGHTMLLKPPTHAPFSRGAMLRQNGGLCRG